MKYINHRETFWQRNQGLKPERANYSILKQARLAWGEVVSPWYLSMHHLDFPSFLILLLAFFIIYFPARCPVFVLFHFPPHLRINLFWSITYFDVNFLLFTGEFEREEAQRNGWWNFTLERVDFSFWRTPSVSRKCQWMGNLRDLISSLYSVNN